MRAASAAEARDALRRSLEGQHPDDIAEAEQVAALLARVLQGPAAALAADAVNRELVRQRIGFAVWRRAGPKLR